MLVKRHIPTFVSHATQRWQEIATIEDLFNLPWIAEWAEDPAFGQWAKSEHGPGRTLLMAMIKDGSYWVVAYVKGDSLATLPDYRTLPHKSHST